MAGKAVVALALPLHYGDVAVDAVRFTEERPRGRLRRRIGWHHVQPGTAQEDLLPPRHSAQERADDAIERQLAVLAPQLQRGSVIQPDRLLRDRRRLARVGKPWYVMGLERQPVPVDKFAHFVVELQRQHVFWRRDLSRDDSYHASATGRGVRPQLAALAAELPAADILVEVHKGVAVGDLDLDRTGRPQGPLLDLDGREEFFVSHHSGRGLRQPSTMPHGGSPTIPRPGMW